MDKYPGLCVNFHYLFWRSFRAAGFYRQRTAMPASAVAIAREPVDIGDVVKRPRPVAAGVASPGA